MSREGWYIIAAIIAALVLAYAIGLSRTAEPLAPNDTKGTTGGSLHATR